MSAQAKPFFTEAAAPAWTPEFQAVLDADHVRDPGLEPRAGDRREGRTVVRTFFSVWAQKRFVVYRTACGSCTSIGIDRWRKWAGVGA